MTKYNFEKAIRANGYATTDDLEKALYPPIEAKDDTIKHEKDEE